MAEQETSGARYKPFRARSTTLDLTHQNLKSENQQYRCHPYPRVDRSTFKGHSS